VPVFDPNDEIVGAMMVAAPLERMRTNYDHLLNAVRTFGRQASGLGGEPDPSPM
jgi:IclR family acetate operon transcriptional repressor